MSKMKIDIWVTTDDGVDYHGENLSWSEACGYIMNLYLQAELIKTLNSDYVKDYIGDIAKERNNEK